MAFKETMVQDKKLCKIIYLRKITDIVTLGMQNEGCGKYLDVQRVIGRIGLVRAFEISVKSITYVKLTHKQNF
jgi:hypothetical protein